MFEGTCESINIGNSPLIKHFTDIKVLKNDFFMCIITCNLA